MPLSEDEQRVLDEIERQLQLEPARPDPRPVRLARERESGAPPTSRTPPTLLIGVALVLALGVVVVGVLVGGMFGVLVAVTGYAAFVVGGVALSRNSQGHVHARLDALVARYQGPPSSGPDGR